MAFLKIKFRFGTCLMTEYQEVCCRADTPFDKRIYRASFVGKETLSLPKPDVKFSCQRQTTTLTHTHAHTHTMNETHVIEVGHP